MADTNTNKAQMTADERLEAARQKRYVYMTQTPMKKLILQLSVPTIISMMVTGLYNTADTFFVGRISTQATAAVGIVFPIMTLIQATGFFCGQGSGTFVSRKLGAGEIKEANEMAATGFSLALLLGLCFSILGFLFMRPIARFLGATPTLIDDTISYMRIILIGSPYMMAQLVVNNQLRFQGSAVYAMAGLVSGALLNIGLDPLFIFVFGMGVAGAALATILSQLVAFVILLIGSYRGPNIHINFKNVRFSKYYLLHILNGGAPSFARQGLASVSTILLNTTAGAYGGDAAIAGMSVVGRIMFLMLSALLGFGQGFQPSCGFNYGAKLYKRVREGYWFCVRLGFVILLCVSIPAFIFAPQIIAFFRNDPDVIAVGKVALRFQSSIFPLSAFTIISNMMTQSMGKGVRATLQSACRSGLFFIPFILILPRFFGLLGVEMTQTCSDLCTFLITIPTTLPLLMQMKKAEEGEA